MKSNHPSLSNFISIYPPEKKNRNIFKIWRWLVIGRLSLLISWVAVRLKISANQVTIISFAFALISFYFFCLGKAYFFAASVFLNMWYLFDCSDGHVARYYKINSKVGKFLDDSLGEVVITMMWFFIGVGIYKTPDFFAKYLIELFELNIFFIVLGAVTSIVYSLRNVISNRFSQNYNIKSNQSSKTNIVKLNFILILFNNLKSIGGFMGVLLIIFSIINYLSLFLVFYFILFTLIIFYSFINYYKKLSSLDK